jgi:uncharacterized protein YndB with AHSA1/START domain
MMKDEELELERVIPGKPEQVFALWTEPTLLLKWWGPEGYEIPTHALDIRPGGKWRTTMRSPEGRLLTVSGVYRKIERPRLLVFTWAWDDEQGRRGHESEVTVTFEPAPGGTRLVLRQMLESKDARDRHAHGWSSTFDRLARVALS